MVNRSAMIFRPKQPFIDWVRSLGPDTATADCDGERVVYLIPEIEEPGADEQILEQVWQTVFEAELSSWDSDESTWPTNMTLEMCREWFRIEVCSIVEDLCGWEIDDDHTEG